MQRAVVLGGGGMIGVAWETGLAHGLKEAGVDLCAFDLYMGTSAGAIVGSQLANGRLPAAPTNDDVELGQARMTQHTFDLDAAGKIFGLWVKMQHTTPEQAAQIGGYARAVRPDEAERWIGMTAERLPVHTWPDKPLIIATVDTETGKRVLWRRDDEVDLLRAVAASSAVPSLIPPVKIGERFYMDGQVQSSTNADALVDQKLDTIVIVMPTNSVTAPGIGDHAERMLQMELAILRDAGKRVHVATPSPNDRERLGQNLMDPTRMPAAYEVGLEAGRAFAKELL